MPLALKEPFRGEKVQTCPRSPYRTSDVPDLPSQKVQGPKRGPLQEAGEGAGARNRCERNRTCTFSQEWDISSPPKRKNTVLGTPVSSIARPAAVLSFHMEGQAVVTPASACLKQRLHCRLEPTVLAACAWVVERMEMSAVSIPLHLAAVRGLPASRQCRPQLAGQLAGELLMTSICCVQVRHTARLAAPEGTAVLFCGTLCGTRVLGRAPTRYASSGISLCSFPTAHAPFQTLHSLRVGRHLLQAACSATGKLCRKSMGCTEQKASMAKGHPPAPQ